MYCLSPTAYVLCKASHPHKLRLLKNSGLREILGSVEPYLKSALLGVAGCLS